MLRLITNLIISAAALVGGIWLYHHFYPEPGQITPEAVEEGGLNPDGPQDQALPSERLQITEYKVIGEKNLFRPERSEWTPAAAAVEQPGTKEPGKKSPSQPTPRLTLYGTIIYGDNVRIAIIKGDVGVKGEGPGEGKESYHLGDEISGYRINEIGEDRVRLVKGDDVIVLKLREGKEHPGAMPPPIPASQITTQPPPPASAMQQPAKVETEEEPDRIVVKGPNGEDIIKRKKVIRTPFGPKTIYIEERE